MTIPAMAAQRLADLLGSGAIAADSCAVLIFSQFIATDRSRKAQSKELTQMNACFDFLVAGLRAGSRLPELLRHPDAGRWLRASSPATLATDLEAVIAGRPDPSFDWYLGRDGRTVMFLLFSAK